MKFDESNQDRKKVLSNMHLWMIGSGHLGSYVEKDSKYKYVSK